MTCKLTAEQCKQLVDLADKHRAADEYIAGTYGKISGKKWIGGCAIGCTVRDAKSLGILPEHTYDGAHAKISEATGVPKTIWYLCDTMFEGLPAEHRRQFTPTFLRTLKPGVDYSNVWPQFAIFILHDCRQYACAEAADLIDKCIDAYQRHLRGEAVTQDEWNELSASAYTAKSSAAEAAAYAAAESAYPAACAPSAMLYAADAANDAANEDTSDDANEDAAWIRFRDEFLRLMAAAGETT